jgi:ribosome-binding protein aMBF1 (putative translation factor)
MESNRSRTIRKNRVRELRENRLMTQAQLARKAKVALRTIHSVEKGPPVSHFAGQGAGEPHSPY